MLAQWFVGACTLALALATIWVTLIKPWWNKPKFSIKFDNCTPYCRETWVKGSSTTDDRTYQQVPAYWIRLKITNSGKSLAKRCVGKLAKVMNESGEELSGYDPVQLHWVGTSWEDVPFRYIDLNPSEYEYLDILYTRADSLATALICKDLLPRGIPNHFKPGKHRLQITIYGDNVDPKSKTYALTFGASNIKDIRLDEKETNIRRGESKQSIATRWVCTHLSFQLAVAFLGIAIGLFGLGIGLATKYPLSALFIFSAAYVTLITAFIRFVAELFQRR